MKRGEVYYAGLSPTIGSEITKRRPVLIVSNNANNKASSTITVLPITSNVSKIYPFEVKLDPVKNFLNVGLTKISKVQCQQIRTISKLRITGAVIGEVDKNTLYQIDLAIKLHLDIS